MRYTCNLVLDGKLVRVISATNFNINEHKDLLDEPTGSTFILNQYGETDTYHKEDKGWVIIPREKAKEFVANL